MSRLSARARQAIPASKFAGPKGHFPIENKDHVRAAKREEKFATPAERAKIDTAARRDGVGGDGKVFADHHQPANV